MTEIVYNNLKYIEIPRGKGFYFINKETTQILSLMRPNAPKVLKPTINSNGYYMVGFFSKKDRINVNIHRAMMETFVENENNYPHINHIDGNKLNNNLSNLEYCTAKHNAQHKFDIGLANQEHCEKEVHQYNLNGRYLASYKSLHAAARAVNTSASCICYNVTGKTKHSSGYIWSYTKKDNLSVSVNFPSSYTVINSITQKEKVFTKGKDAYTFLGISKTTFYKYIRENVTEMGEYTLKINY